MLKHEWVIQILKRVQDDSSNQHDSPRFYYKSIINQ